MRNINVSSAVFAAIWKAHKDGEETEDAILRRILKLPVGKLTETPPTGGRMGGFYDERSGTHFPEGMRIFRTYKGHKVEALANLDRWYVASTGQSFHSLHKLSQSVNIGSNENAWANWKYRDENGVDHLIAVWRENNGRKNV
jgi:hypothetical protein